MAEFVEDPKPGVPMWLVSFGDMMTLILTFFILLVSMASQRKYGLVADGLGSFVAALSSHGLPGRLTESERIEIFNNFRRRFNLPPEPDPEKRVRFDQASDKELLRALTADALAPHRELFQPQVALFDDRSYELSPATRAYLDRLAPTLSPGPGQLLVIEGKATDAEAADPDARAQLAFLRASAVRDWLVKEHDCLPQRLEARAWLDATASESASSSVDARLITPARHSR
jgi:chemotaxis protein MotB